MKFFDAHVHFVHHCSIEELRNKCDLMEQLGFGGMDVLSYNLFHAQHPEVYADRV